MKNEMCCDKNLENIIWILGAPTNSVFENIKSNIDTFLNPIVVICADLSKYSLTNGWLGTTDNLDVYNLPTNFRNHASKYGDKYVQLGNTLVKDNESFKDAQHETSVALSEILNLCKIRNIKTYFANIDRLLRPTYIIQDTKGEFGEVNLIMGHDHKETKGVWQKIPNSRKDISQQILRLLLMYDVNDMSEKSILYRKKLEEQMLISSAYHASFMADVLTVACMLIDDENVWENYTLDYSNVCTDGTFPKKGVLTEALSDISYVRAKFTTSPIGIFNKFNQKSVDTMTEKLSNILNNIENDINIEKKFNNSIVYHDSFLNDIDDFPAIELIKFLSNSTKEILTFCVN